MKSITYKHVTKKTYDVVAEDYVKRDRGVVPETFEVKDALERFIKLLGRGAAVLDIGSGGGRDARFLCQYGLRVVGIDFSRNMVDKARKTSPGITFRVMDLEHLKFKLSSFRGVWANASLHHVPKNRLPRILGQIYRVLKSDGIFFIKVKYGSGEGLKTSVKFGKRITRYFAFYHARELNKLLRKAGFEILSSAVGPRREWLDVFTRKS